MQEESSKRLNNGVNRPGSQSALVRLAGWLKKQFFPSHLPRTHGLNFNIPRMRKQAVGPVQSGRAFRTMLKDLQAEPELLLQEVANNFIIYNQHKTSAATRLRLAEMALLNAAPAINHVYFSYQGRARFPESTQRYEAISAAILTVEQLLIAYKRVMQHYYKLPGLLYRFRYERVWHCGFRIMELSQLEQRLCALRYQKSPESTWQDCHRLFFAAYESRAMSELHTLTSCLRPGQAVVEPETRFYDNDRKAVSIQQLYANIQLLGLMDVSGWSERDTHIVESYISMADFQIIARADVGNTLPENNLLIHRDLTGPPRFVESEEDEGEEDSAVLYLNITPLIERMHDDHMLLQEKIDNPRDERIVKPLAIVDTTTALGIIKSMQNKLRQYKRKYERVNSNQYLELRIYFGFKECFRIINESRNPEMTEINDSPGLHEILAQRSEALVDYNNNATDKSWFLINESDGGMLLRIEDSPFTNEMYVGQLIAVCLPEQEQSVPRLAYIGRLQRSGDNDVELSIVYISTYAEIGGLQDPVLYKENKALPVILLQDQNHHWRLLIQNKNNSYLDGPLFLKRANQFISVTIGQQKLGKTEFSLYSIANKKASDKKNAAVQHAAK